jgi:hypothetical protein
MATIQEFRCEVCGIVTSNPTHWFVIGCGESALTVHRWNTEAANAEAARQTRISCTLRWIRPRVRLSLRKAA